MNNHNIRPFLLLLTAVVTLLASALCIPERIGGYEMKTVDLLADIRESDEADSVLIADTLAVPEDVKEEVPDSIRLIEDYSDSSEFGMKHFYEALRNIDDMDRPVRIAYFGDSFIEGDIYTADIRELLQDKFGGCGIGLADIASPLAGVRFTLPTHSSGWDTHNVLMHDSIHTYQASRLGITQHYAIPTGPASAMFSGTSHCRHLDRFETARLYLRSEYPIEVTAKLNKDTVMTYFTEGNGTIEEVRCDYPMTSVQWSLTGNSGVTCFGTALEGNGGITLDNLSLRGSSGMTLASIPQEQWQAIAASRQYDLIVLHFGLNVASKKVMKYDYYVKGMKRVINILKQSYPNAGILIVGVSDRENRIDGELKTMPSIKALIKYQQLMASENHVAFWNLYEAMGGEGSIVEMSKMKPKGARLDYTHITREGGRHLSAIFVNSLMYCYDKYKENN